MKRVVLFLLTNIAVLMVLGVVLSILMPVLGLDRSSYSGLLFMCGVFGMGGSFISLAMSKWIAKRSVGANVIQSPTKESERWLLATVQNQASKAGIGMPEVAVYQAPEINAFATGMNRNNALVAVSSGLLNRLDRDEVEAVLGHEISHIANGDMVTLTLIQGVLNTFVFFFARIAASAISRGSNNRLVYFMTVMAFQAAFGILASVIVMWFSRRREFRADEGGAELAGKAKMIAALQKLQAGNQNSTLDGQLTAFGLSGKPAMSALFMSHPPIEQRIRALQAI